MSIRERLGLQGKEKENKPLSQPEELEEPDLTGVSEIREKTFDVDKTLGGIYVYHNERIYSGPFKDFNHAHEYITWYKNKHRYAKWKEFAIVDPKS
jgi:hypothetical protein